MIQRPFEQAPSAEPVVVEAECRNSILLGDVDLLGQNFRNPQVVEALISGKTRLVMPDESRSRFGDVPPFGKVFTPPAIIFGNGMKLRQVKGDCLNRDATRVEGVARTRDVIRFPKRRPNVGDFSAEVSEESVDVEASSAVDFAGCNHGFTVRGGHAKVKLSSSKVKFGL